MGKYVTGEHTVKRSSTKVVLSTLAGFYIFSDLSVDRFLSELYSLGALQVCSWDQKKGRVWKWFWSKCSGNGGVRSREGTTDCPEGEEYCALLYCSSMHRWNGQLTDQGGHIQNQTKVHRNRITDSTFKKPSKIEHMFLKKKECSKWTFVIDTVCQAVQLPMKRAEHDNKWPCVKGLTALHSKTVKHPSSTLCLLSAHLTCFSMQYSGPWPCSTTIYSQQNIEQIQTSFTLGCRLYNVGHTHS